MNLRHISVRGLMIATMIVAISISTGTWVRQRWLKAEAFYHEKLTYHRTNAAFHRFSLEKKPLVWVPIPPPSAADLDWARRSAEYHEAMILKYERALHYPWLPVAPDPIAPQ
jgi:hypothetical protein